MAMYPNPAIRCRLPEALHASKFIMHQNGHHSRSRLPAPEWACLTRLFSFRRDLRERKCQKALRRYNGEILSEKTGESRSSKGRPRLYSKK